MKNEKESNAVLMRLQKAVYQFLQKDSNLIGFLPEDSIISTAVKRQIPFVLLNPKSYAAKQINIITQVFLSTNLNESKIKNNTSFIEKLKIVLFRK